MRLRPLAPFFALLLACGHDDATSPTALVTDADVETPLGDANDGRVLDASDARALDPSDAASIPKWVSPLPIPAVHVPTVIAGADGRPIRHEYVVDVQTRAQQVLPDGWPTTTIWGYGGPAKRADGTIDPDFRAWPGATFEATRGIPVRVTWKNALTGSHLFAVDPTLHWADPNDAGMPMPPFPNWPGGFASAETPVPLVAHLHGGEVPSASDGFPMAWTTADGKHGSAYGSLVAGQTNAATFEYPNAQPPTTLWYHDHALGLTRLNVLGGLAGFYLLRDPADAIASALPSGKYEVPLVIQDRSFHADGSLAFGADGVNPDVHPYWEPEFFGDAIVVNGRTWPRLDVEPRTYRFRILNGSNARFYDLRLVDDAANTIAFTQIGIDGGYLPAPVTLDRLLVAPGERVDVLVDFEHHPGGTLRFVNDARAPYPDGDAPDPRTTGQILQFAVQASAPVAPPALPATLNAIPTLTADSPTRVLTLLELEGAGGPLVGTLNGQRWDAPTSETPRVGSTEDWLVANLTDDGHPIHLHLVRFQLVSRQPFDDDAYEAAWRAKNGEPTFPVDGAIVPLDPTPYFQGSARSPEPNERGWKDTLVMMPHEVTRIRVRVAPTTADATGAMAPAPGKNLFPFDPTTGPGYVWHCHILDHEDNEMMRPLRVTP